MIICIVDNYLNDQSTPYIRFGLRPIIITRFLIIEHQEITYDLESYVARRITIIFSMKEKSDDYIYRHIQG